MSLINKVLLDLDNRTQNNAAASANHPLFANLQPVGAPATVAMPKRLWSLLLLTLILLSSGGSGWYYWKSHHLLPAASTAPQAAITQSTTVTLAHNKEAVATVTPARPKPVPAPVVTAVVESTPVPSAPVKASPVVTAPPPAPTPAPAPKHAAVAMATPAPVAVPKEEPQLQRTMRPLSPEEQAEEFFRKGTSLLRTGQGPEGERALRKALTLDPKNTEARETLTVVLLEGRRFEEAKQLLSEGITLLPSYAPFSARLARIYVEQGDEARALNLLESNRARATPDAAYLGLLGTLYQRASKHAEARDAFRQALGLQTDESRWWLGLGISSEALRDWPAARDAYRHSILNTQTPPRVRQYAEQRLSIVSSHLP
jgi:MSHA biogenesis protein MshN